MKTIVRNAGEGEQRWFYGGGVHTWKVSAEDTDGEVSIFEDVMERGKTTPLHSHPSHVEVVVVLEGEILIHANGEPRTIGAGGIVVQPRGVPHAFAVTSERARMLVIATPGTVAESFYRSASIDATEGSVDFAKIGAAAKETGATLIMGPPPFAKP
jgi:quercetin dioxygenase-like cupin family protein